MGWWPLLNSHERGGEGCHMCGDTVGRSVDDRGRIFCPRHRDMHNWQSPALDVDGLERAVSSVQVDCLRRSLNNRLDALNQVHDDIKSIVNGSSRALDEDIDRLRQARQGLMKATEATRKIDGIISELQDMISRERRGWHNG